MFNRCTQERQEDLHTGCDDLAANGRAKRGEWAHFGGKRKLKFERKVAFGRWDVRFAVLQMQLES